MTYKPFRLGTAKVYLPKKTNTQLSSTIVASLAWTASSTTATDLIVNDANPPLETGANYYVCLAPLGEDRTNGGLTSTKPTPQQGPVTISDPLTDGISLHIAASDYPTNMKNSFAMLIWMKKNSGDWKRQGYAYIDPDNDFNHMITSEPTAQAQSYTTSQIYATTNDPEDLGSRSPYTIDYVQLTPKTSEGLQIDRQPVGVTVSPDTSQDVQLTSARGASLRFRLLSNSMKDIVRGNAGLFAQFTARVGGATISNSSMSLQSAVALLSGNLPFKIVYPIDSEKVSETKVFLNTIAQSQAASSEQWGRDNVAAVEWSINMISFDTYLQDVQTEISYRRKA